jgi:hypothetical protein
MAGIKIGVNGEVINNAMFLDGINHKTHQDYVDVQCIDELCLIVRSKDFIPFDEAFQYHWYGADLCLKYIQQGYKNFAINAKCTHLSDGISNLLHQDNLKMYIDHGAYLYNKWFTKIPIIRTTTALFNKFDRSFTLFIAPNLRSRGIVIKDKIYL